jgi:hypothetical protein
LATGVTGLGSFTLTQVDILEALGATLSIIGGLMIVVGFKAQFDLWNPKGMKKRGNEDAPKTGETQEPLTI